MPVVKKDSYSKSRYISVIKFTFLIGAILSFFVYMSSFIFSIYAMAVDTLEVWLSIIIIVYSTINLINLGFLFIQETDKPYYIRSGFKSNWYNEKKWLIITFLSINIIFIFIGYMAIQRKIYNALF